MRRATLLLLLGGIARAAAGQTPSTPAEIDRFVGGFLAARVGKDIHSASVIVVQGDSVLYAKSFGLARAGDSASVTRTIYQVGSVSKLFVAVAALQLVEQKRLRLDEDINQYLNDLRVDGRGAPVTMVQLLTHTSGIQDRKLGRAQALSGGPLMTLGAFFRRYPPERVVQGGREINYSGNAVALAAHVIEVIAGEQFDRYAERRIFGPLGMTDATFRQPLPDSLRARRAAMLDVPPLIAYPEGGLAMTTANMGRFLIAMLNDGRAGDSAILRPETVRLMQAHHFPADSSVSGIAYGFFEARLNGHRALVHTGDYQHQSVLVLVPDARLGFFFVANPYGELHAPLVTAFASAMARVLLSPLTGMVPPSARTLDDAEARAFVGLYRDNAIPRSTTERFYVGLLFGEGDARVSYDRASRTLLFEPPGAKPLALVALGRDRFRTADDSLGAQLVFRRIGDRVEGLYVSAGVLGAYSFDRIPAGAGQLPQLGFLAAALLTLGSWLLYALIRRLRRRRVLAGGGPVDHRERPLILLASTAAAIVLGGFAVWAVLALNTPALPMITGVPPFFYALPVAFTLAAIVAIPLLVAATIAWRHRTFTLPVRVLFTLVALVSVLLVAFARYWGLLGIRI
jgi:CubicO group peptidase (beta-lactamase class C family)